MPEYFFKARNIFFSDRHNHCFNNDNEGSEIKMTTSIASTFGNFTDDELNRLKKAVRELSDVYTMQEAQRETVKEIIAGVYEDLKIPKSIIRKIAKAYHKRNYDAIMAENEEFSLFYEGTMKEGDI
jgi:hypothetical protein